MLFLLTGPVWFVANVLIAFVPTNLVPVLLVFREFWCVIFITYIFVSKENNTEKLYMLVTLVYAVISVIINYSEFSISVVYYGFRDMVLLLLLYYSFKKEWQINVTSKFIGFILLLSFLQIFHTFIYTTESTLAFFRINEYYSSKGIQTNINGGLSGVRLLFPLYSTGLLGTLLITSLLVLRRGMLNRLFTLTAAIFTMSKVVLVFPFLMVVRRYRLVLLGFVISVFVLLPVGVNWILETQDVGILTFHAASVRDRFNVLPLFWDSFMKFSIPLLGQNSVAGHVLMGLDPSEAPESLLIARAMDYGLLMPLFLAQLGLLYFTLKRNHSVVFLVILVLFLFTSLSNHPIAFLPLMFCSKYL